MDVQRSSLTELDARFTAINASLFTSVQTLLKNKSINEIKKIILSGDLSALYFLFDLSIKSEDYNICAAIKQVIAERPLPGR